MRSKSSMVSSGQDRSARTSSGIFARGWFNSCAGRGLRGISGLRGTSGFRGTGLGATHKCEGETPMLRKMILVIAALAAIGGAVALSSNEASARWGGGRGWGGGHAFGSVGIGRVGGLGWRGAGWRGAGWGWRGAGWRGAGWGWRGARVAGWGWRGPGGGGWGWRRAGLGWGGWGWRRAGWGWGWGLGSLAFAGTYSCTRWVPTAWGWSRVWVC